MTSVCPKFFVMYKVKHSTKNNGMSTETKHIIKNIQCSLGKKSTTYNFISGKFNS